jgi:predicted ATPase/class 3 adenylate cyclase
VRGAPTGTVTFLFTDIEGSTRLWETDAAAMRNALARHDEILRRAIGEHGGHVFATGGDSFAAAFSSGGDALAAAAAAQVELQASGLPAVRMGIHTGEAVERDGDYFGPTVNRTARLMAIGHGGQVLVSSATERVALEHELRDLGRHRLRDLLEPEHVFQLCIAGVRNEFGPLASLDILPTNLPVQLTSFVGRENECKSVVGLLADHRLVTITGVGGVGKTRLALQCSADLLPDFRDGVWVAELAQAEDDGAFADVVAVALRAPSRPGVSRLDSIVEFLQSRELLLVVDNCEHLIATAFDLIERILQACPSVRVLATSREGLGVPGEQLWPLRSLAMPGPVTSVAELAGADAVRLFMDRAVSVDPAFTLDDTNAASVADICRRLDGIPLAIELAAARIGAMGPNDIASLLDERFRLLTGGRRRAVERHHTLRAAVDWSYQLLDELNRIVFDRLGVFVGSFDAAAAQAVASGAGIETFDVIDALGELVGKSMLTVEHIDGHSRYQLLETLRQYALEQLDSRDESDTYRRRHAAYYAEVATELGPQLLGPDEIASRARFDADVDNYRAAVGWSVEGPPDDHDFAVQIVGSLARECVLNRDSGFGSWAERILDAIARPEHPRWHVVMTTAVYTRYQRGSAVEAEALANDALALCRERDDLVTAAWTTMAIANIAASFGDINRTVAIYDDLLTWVPGASSYDASVVPGIFALFLTVLGDNERALDLATHGLEAARIGGQPSALAIALYAHAMVTSVSDRDVARRECEESLALTEQGASDVVHANTLGLLARIAEADGDARSAARYVARAIAFADRVGDRPPMIDSMFTTARIMHATGAAEPLATIMGAIQEGWFAPMSLLVQGEYDVPPEALAAVRSELGAETYDRARARGAAMTYDQIVAFTLGALEPLTT